MKKDSDYCVDVKNGSLEEFNQSFTFLKLACPELFKNEPR